MEPYHLPEGLSFVGQLPNDYLSAPYTIQITNGRMIVAEFIKPGISRPFFPERAVYHINSKFHGALGYTWPEDYFVLDDKQLWSSKDWHVHQSHLRI